MITTAFYLYTETTSLEEVIITAETVNAVWDTFAQEFPGRRVSYVRDLGPAVPLVTFG
jgi:hypothetical protein